MPAAAGHGPDASPFLGFWMGGFEGADHVNGHGQPLDPNMRNGHAVRFAEDYAAAKRLGLHVVRESIGWRIFEAGGAAAMLSLQAQARAAASQGLQVVWSLMHYGWPDRLDPLARPGQFIDAFSRHCRLVAELIADVVGPPPVYQPVNEISFLAWAATSTDLIQPCRPPVPEKGPELKRTLVRAALRGIDALWSVAPGARIVHTDPAIHVEPPLGAGPADSDAAARETASQFEAWEQHAKTVTFKEYSRFCGPDDTPTIPSGSSRKRHCWRTTWSVPGTKAESPSSAGWAPTATSTCT